jgi:hypothetical protein
MPWSQVAAYSDRFEADLVVARLREIGIAAYVSADDLGGTLPLMQLAEGGCRVLVPAQQVSAARREITRVGSYATDTTPLGPRRAPSPADTTERRFYVVVAILSILGGYGLWRILFSIVWR